MSAMRQPVIGGISGGVGTSMIAALIDGLDVGVVAGDGSRMVDVLVARSTDSATKAAIRASTAMPVHPVLVVIAHSPERWPAPVEQRLKMAAPNLPGIVRVSWISYLAGCVDPWSELLTGIYAQYPPKWGVVARKERERIFDAVAPLVRRPAPLQTPGYHVDELVDDGHDPPSSVLTHRPPATAESATGLLPRKATTS